MTGNELMGISYVFFSIVGIVLGYYMLHWTIIIITIIS